MNMLLHHQKRRSLMDGSIINIGEDGCPYADNELLIVADGLGGRGGYPHTKINPDILNREIFYSKFIAPVVGAAPEAYAQFVTNSFSELFELKEKYFTGTSAMRTSGYFASRLVTAIVLYALKFIPELRREVIFENVRKTEGEKQKEYLDSVRNKLAALIQMQLSEIAKGMGLELESKTKGSYLLPTTLTIALIDETASGLDVLYLWAGDSRGYLWDAEGLAQITDDHERDETMTNLITLTKPFQLEARLLKTNKPVILFNATDGCYKCPCFASAFDLEYVFLQALVSANSLEDTAKFLDRQFTEIGTHDDSNTMALTSFGYESFEGIKAAVSKRLNDLQEQMIRKLPDILERDYVDELNQIDEQVDGSIFAVKDSFIEVEPIVELVKQKMVEEGYAPYVQELNSLEKSLGLCDKEEASRNEKILNWVQYYWLRTPCLKKLTVANGKFMRGDSYEKIFEMESVCSEEKQRYIGEYSKALEELSENISAITGMRDSILKLETSRNKTDKVQLSKNIKTAKDLLGKIEDGIVKGKIEKAYSRFFKGNDELTELTSRYVKQDADAITGLAHQIEKNEFKILVVEMPEVCRQSIESFLKALQRIAEERAAINAEINGLKDKHLMGYWNVRFHDLIVSMRREHAEIIPEEIKSRLAENIGDLQAKREKIAHCLEIRNRLYDIYAGKYRRYFKESTL